MKSNMKILSTLFVLISLFAISSIGFAGPSGELYNAVRDGDTAKVQQLLDAGASPDGPDNDGWPLSEAITKDRLEIVKLLVARNARLDLRVQGIPPLGLAANWDRTAIFEYLLTLDLNQDNKGYALAEYARKGKEDQVSRLLLASAPPDGLSLEGSALGNAAAGGYVEIVKKLLIAGADARMTYQGAGISGLRCALLEALGNPDLVRLLIRSGGDVNFRTDARSRPAEHTLLMIAAGKGNLDVVKALVEAGADAKAKNPAGDTAAVIALRNGHTAVAQYLAPSTLLPSFPPLKL